MASWRHQHVHEPEQGDVLHFKSPSHAIYDGFPSGNTVPSTEVFINFDAPVHVVQSRRSSWSRWHKGKRKWVVAKYVAVEFERDGRSLWTNFSRDGEQWLWTHPEMTKYWDELDRTSWETRLAVPDWYEDNSWWDRSTA